MVTSLMNAALSHFVPVDPPVLSVGVKLLVGLGVFVGVSVGVAIGVTVAVWVAVAGGVCDR